MCGIAGILSSGPIIPSDKQVVQVMASALRHRGPDEEGIFTSAAHASGAQASLAIRRLSIIDLRAGSQPLFNEDRTIALVANGEIYNYLELRGELIARGHKLRTGSDCEVIVHLYEEFGEECLAHIRGMFAFALYDQRIGKLLLARDRLGEKPLYIHQGPRAVYFASEAKAFIRAGVIPFEMENEAIYQYLHWGFVPEPRSAIRHVSKVRAGHFVTVESGSLRLQEHRYWNPRELPVVRHEPADALRAELETVAKLTVRSDVPVGVCLSAGVDSSAVAALAAKNYPGTITGVTLGFTGAPRQDERAGARRFARHLGIPLVEIEITPQDAARVLPALCAAGDEPLNDLAGSSIYCMMQRCRAEGLKVMLNGLGGDELFWGYGWTRRALMLTERKRRRLAGDASFVDYLAVTTPALSYNQVANWLAGAGGLSEEMRRFFQDPRHPERMVFWDVTPSFVDAVSRVPSLLRPDYLPISAEGVSFIPFSSDAWPERLDIEFVCLMLETYLREIGLAQSDRLSSANSVEVRTPLVDYRFVELAIGLQMNSAQSGIAPKAALLAALSNLLPTWLTSRKKQGFSNPWRSWTREFAKRYGLLLIDGVLVQKGVLRADRAASICARLDPGLVGKYDSLAHGMLRLELWARGMESLRSTRPDVQAVRGEEVWTVV